MDTKKLKNFNYIYKKLLPIRDIDEASKKKLRLISKSFEGTAAIPLIEKIYFEQLSYFFKLFFRNDFEKTITIYNEKKKTDKDACVKQYNYLINKIHHYIQLCEGNITLVNVRKTYVYHVRNRIHALLFQFTNELEDLFFLYYSQAFKRYNGLYYDQSLKEKEKQENEDKSYRLSDEDRTIVVVPELNNYVIRFDTWDSSDFYKEYLEQLEEEDNNDNFSDLIYDEENSMSKDSLIIDTEKEKGRDKDKDKDDISMNESIEDQNMDEDENEGNEDNKKNEDENEDIEMKDSNENSSDSSNSESESSDDNDDYIKEKDNEDNNSNSDDDSSISSEKENEKDKLISDDYDSDMDEDKYETIADDDYVMGTKEFLKQFAINSSNIISDHFLYRYEAIISNVIYRHIKHVILKHNRGVFNQPCLVKSLAWYKCALIPFQKIIWQPNLYPENEKSFISWNARIRYYIYKTYFDIRTSELFDIIVEYPDSKWSLIDLKISIKKTGLIKELISSLNESIKKRLLHQGAKTSDIVHQYISLIKCMQILDSSGLLLEQVSDPIKKYLRYREDTIKCIVQIIADDNNENLLESIPKQDIIAFDEMNLNNYNNDNWMPELLEIDPANEVVKKKSVDIISTLLNIYDSKDVFIKEFQELLANRLLALKSYELKRELRNLELLKLRFGENNLQLCEVMIKDISSSRRIDYNIHTETNFDDNSNNNKNEKDNNKELPFHAKILSHLFWPPFKPNNLKFPKEIQEYADIYSKQYTTLKPSRKLQWLPYLGYVSLTVELEDRTLTFNDLTPIQAIILYHFQEKDQWELNELSNKLEVTPAVVKHGIVFWMNKGIMKEITKDVYKILEKEEDVMIEDEEIHNTVEDAEDNIEEQSSKGQDTDQMRIYWTFISNMITNLGGMTIERIHQMLQVCLPNYKSQIEQLRSFLELMIHENKLDLNDDVYTIKK